MAEKIKIAVLDDYQQVSEKFADWSVLNDHADITIFDQHESNEDILAERLFPYEIICIMRERTPMKRTLLSKLSNLKLIISTGRRNASVDVHAAEDLGITIKNTGYVNSGAPELTWALLMAIARKIPQESQNVRSGLWQTTIGTDLNGKTIGIIGLGNIGSKIARYAAAFDMKVLAWSPNLTKEKAEVAGAVLVSKNEIFSNSDFVTVHMVLSERSKGIIAKEDLSLMKSTAYLINTSRGPLIKEADLIEILQQKKIRGAALDVFDTEPLPPDHSFRRLDNVLATPHIGYVTEDTYKVFYQDTVQAIQDWMISQTETCK
jgi:phosphoglycerate dehydrogenase-like enzyme